MKRTFRKGQKVRSIYDPLHEFVIDKSVIPERIYHEKGTDRWWVKSELQRITDPQNPQALLSPRKKEQLKKTRPLAFKGAAAKLRGEAKAYITRECLFDGAMFVPKRKHQKFCNDDCRRGFHRRAEVPQMAAS